MKKFLLSLVLSSMTLALCAADKPANGACCAKTGDKASATCPTSAKTAQCSGHQCSKQALLSPKAAAETTKKS